MDEYDVGYYDKINAEEAEQAQRLADLLLWKYAPQSVLDVGCATGLYLKPFLDKGITASGVDYSKSAIADEVLQIPRQLIKTIDITKQAIGKTADLTLCIEVLEHIAADAAKAAVDHIAGTSDTIFFSAAQPGQGGVGHINCQPKAYWESHFEASGFNRDAKDEDYFRIIMSAGYHMGWLINNLMVFKKG